MADVIRFVASVASSPTVRLDLNDETSFWVKKVTATPPRLRRSMSSNAMRDGVYVGSASYDSRTLVIELECRKSTQDAAATEIQKLWRELDRASNWLQYQPAGATKPVFFRTMRSDTSGLEDVVAQAAMRTFTIEVLAESHAVGLMETLGPFTVNNDPAAGSNPGYVDISGVIGDVAADAIFWNQTANRAATLMAIRHDAFSDIRPWIQCESLTLGTDTANPGGGPDAAMSGTGTNNYVRTTFSGATMASRLSGDINTGITGQVGSFVIYAAVRRTDATSVIKVGCSASTASAPDDTTTVPLSTARQLVRVGRFSTDGTENFAGRVKGSNLYRIWAQRESGTGNLEWDCLFFVPADSAMLEATSYATSTAAGDDDVFDGVADRASAIIGGGNPTTFATEAGPLRVAGRIPQVRPNNTSRLFFLTSSTYDSTGLRTHVKTETNAITIYYWPRYLHVRPVST
ncbi:hypothetical protein [Nocardioides sp.]|uniref:hypothetical protein n=1 Tax=Nocardioides sp. TaxID=35761 RepID=UPI0035B4C9DD